MRKDLAESHYHFGLMWKAKGDVHQAIAHLEAAAGIFEELRLNRWASEVGVTLRTLKT